MGPHSFSLAASDHILLRMNAIKSLAGVHINQIGVVCITMDDIPACTALKID